jgi:hypothetical protein
VGFQRRFGIELQYLSSRLGEMAARMLAERAAGLFTLDVVIGGAQTQATVMWEAGMHDPIRPNGRRRVVGARRGALEARLNYFDTYEWQFTVETNSTSHGVIVQPAPP